MSNNYLNSINKDYNNYLMSKKLKDIKPTIITSCPNMFKTKQSKQKTVESFKEFCKRQNDYILFKKLEKIYSGKYKKIDKLLYPFKCIDNNFQSRFASYNKKREIVKIAEENQSIIKRIQNTQSKYNHDKLEDDFKKNQKFVKVLCNQPIKDPIIKKFTNNKYLNSIKTNYKNNLCNNIISNSISNINSIYSNNITTTYIDKDLLKNIKSLSNCKSKLIKSGSNKDIINNKNLPKINNDTKFKSSSNIININSRLNYNSLNNSINNNVESCSKINKNNIGNNNENYSITNNNNNDNDNNNNKKKPNILFSRKAYFNDVGISDVSFYEESKNFYISLFTENKDIPFNYFIVFDNIKSISEISLLYKSYEQIINNLYFLNNKLMINKKGKNIEYNSIAKKKEIEEDIKLEQLILQS